MRLVICPRRICFATVFFLSIFFIDKLYKIISCVPTDLFLSSNAKISRISPNGAWKNKRKKRLTWHIDYYCSVYTFISFPPAGTCLICLVLKCPCSTMSGKEYDTMDWCDNCAIVGRKLEVVCAVVRRWLVSTRHSRSLKERFWHHPKHLNDENRTFTISCKTRDTRDKWSIGETRIYVALCGGVGTLKN